MYINLIYVCGTVLHMEHDVLTSIVYRAVSILKYIVLLNSKLRSVILDFKLYLFKNLLRGQ